MTALDIIAEGRAVARSLMVDTCSISADVPPVYDAASDSYLPAPGTLRYAGPCRVKPRDNADRVVEAAGQTVSLWPYVVVVPVDATDIEVNDRVTITAAGLDPELTDLVLRVRDVPKGSLLTARRLGCEVQSA